VAINKTYRYHTKDQLYAVLDSLLSIHSVKVLTIKIDPGWVIGTLSGDIDVPHPADNILDEIRRHDVVQYPYEGKFTLDVLFAVMGEIKRSGLVPGYLLLAPGSFMKELPHWECAAVTTIAGTKFLGMDVVEDDRLDNAAFVVAACSGETPSLYTITKSYKGTDNE